VSTAGSSPTYITYIFRCWQEGSLWRYSLEEPGSGQRHGFAGLDDFVAFLLAQSSPQNSIETAGSDTRDPEPNPEKKGWGSQ
jgi:hypothetical protein